MNIEAWLGRAVVMYLHFKIGHCVTVLGNGEVRHIAHHLPMPLNLNDGYIRNEDCTQRPDLGVER